MCKTSIAANKAHFFQSMLPLHVRKCAVPPDDLRSEISSRALVTFRNIGEER